MQVASPEYLIGEVTLTYNPWQTGARRRSARLTGRKHIKSLASHSSIATTWIVIRNLELQTASRPASRGMKPTPLMNHTLPPSIQKRHSHPTTSILLHSF